MHLRFVTEAKNGVCQMTRTDKDSEEEDGRVLRSAVWYPQMCFVLGDQEYRAEQGKRVSS